MRFKVIVLALVAMFATSALASAQSQTGEIFGKVTDPSGGVLPGVTVTLTAPSLLQPLVGRDQRHRHLSVSAPRHRHLHREVRAHGLQDGRQRRRPGDRRLQRPDQRAAGRSRPCRKPSRSPARARSSTPRTPAPSRPSPTICCRAFRRPATRGSSSSRRPASPWTAKTSAATMSGQQSNFVSRGAAGFNTKWSLDGVDITDMAATGSSPNYYDFDTFEEMTINTGGVDVTQQTGGVGINLVTKSGTDRFKGSSRFYDTNDASNRTTSPTRSGCRARRRATRFRTSRTTASRRAGRSRRARPGSGARSASRHHRRRRPQLLSADGSLPADQGGRGRQRAVAFRRRRQRLSEHRRDDAAEHAT